MAYRQICAEEAQRVYVLLNNIYTAVHSDQVTQHIDSIVDKQYGAVDRNTRIQAYGGQDNFTYIADEVQKKPFIQSIMRFIGPLTQPILQHLSDLEVQPADILKQAVIGFTDFCLQLYLLGLSNTLIFDVNVIQQISLYSYLSSKHEKSQLDEYIRSRLDAIDLRPGTLGYVTVYPIAPYFEHGDNKYKAIVLAQWIRS